MPLGNVPFATAEFGVPEFVLGSTTVIPEVFDVPEEPGAVPIPGTELPEVILEFTEPVGELIALPAEPPSTAEASFWQTPSWSKV